MVQRSTEPVARDRTIEKVEKVDEVSSTLARVASPPGTDPESQEFLVQDVPVQRIRPEDGLGRKREREGHLELQRSIERFGVLTPITVRPAPDGSGDFLLIKGQGRTLACRLLGISVIPAVIVDDQYAEDEKVQQFLVENVARLKMRPVDRALLIHRARESGEETTSIAQRFGVTPTTVRRLLAQLEGATSGEVAALRRGDVNLAVHGVLARHVRVSDRDGALSAISETSIKARELEALFVAIGWRQMVDLGPFYAPQRFELLEWVCKTFDRLPPGSIKDRVQELALQFPAAFTSAGTKIAADAS